MSELLSNPARSRVKENGPGWKRCDGKGSPLFRSPSGKRAVPQNGNNWSKPNRKTADPALPRGRIGLAFDIRFFFAGFAFDAAPVVHGQCRTEIILANGCRLDKSHKPPRKHSPDRCPLKK